jgi:hypothetical protein
MPFFVAGGPLRTCTATAALIFLSLIEGFFMSPFRLARLCLLLAAVGLNAAPAVMSGAHAQAPAAAGVPATGVPATETVRPEMFKLLDSAAVKPLLDAKNYSDVQNRITQAEALANKTPYETFIIDQTKLQLGYASGNNPMAITALEAMLASGRLQPAQQSNLLLALGNFHYNAKDYPKAIEVFRRYQKESGTPEQARASLVRAYYLSGDYASARTELQPLVAEAEKAGKVPSQEDLKLLASASHESKDNAGYLAALEKMAIHYPTDDIWLDLINRGVQRRPGFDAHENLIDMYRLKFAAVGKMSPEDYVNLAELALQSGFPTEAKSAVDAGFAAGELGKGANAAQHRQLRDKAAKGAADDARNIAAGEASAAKAKNGAGLVNLGWAYVTMNQYDKGIGFIQQGIAKGGLKQPDEAKLRLGMAYAKAGRKEDALKAFESVKAGRGLSDLAKYWVLLLNRSGGTAAPATAAK